MTDIAIRVQSVGKLYNIGEKRGGYQTLRESLISAFRSRRNGHSNNSNGHAARTFWALRDVSFDVQRGEIVGIIGRNGAGKSTLLKILSRITDPTEGEIEISGRVGSLLEVGTGFHPELTGRENIFLNGAILGMKRAEIAAKFDEIIAFAGTEKFLDTPVKYYSSGMYTRLAFAVAAHLEPEILVVDEVLSVGDAEFQKKCLGKMGDVSCSGRTVLFVSHNMTAVKSLCTRAMWLDAGRIVEAGSASKIVDHYLQKNAQATNLECFWEDDAAAPGNDQVRLRSVRIIPGGDSSDHITVHTPLRIEFIYRNYVPGAALNVSILFKNLDEVCAFNTGSVPTPRSAGLICETVEIPGNLLNAGSYYIDVLIVKDAFAILQHNCAVAFEVMEGRGRGNWYGQVPGVVRPKLKWETNALSETGAVHRID
jgi:lipopolysaccharide transport system ATP-binding protein